MKKPGKRLILEVDELSAARRDWNECGPVLQKCRAFGRRRPETGAVRLIGRRFKKEKARSKDRANRETP